METGMLITVYLTSALVAGLAATLVARAKNRHSGYWMLVCFLLPPLILLLLILPKGRHVYHPRRDPFGEIEDDDGWVGRD
jgi:cyanate permease